ncbi:hypothetical protein Patl_3222 [Paraglaciecola sp. T6c]|uniref:hypothetical protein n=1 Tax=Pseudoalteromonas atlantica (strain T6c / ATCC BAA-1087) TaxID=3042615 RepID=UPI0000DA6E4D|nr:hypothetical protein [Paraglaciecola sp. T6c]ABG41728.1 hypothetical protein Patl_3222 [Paraglaciecola sp. T6c]
MPRKTIAFHRHYQGYTGGHQKVCDYLKHTLACGLYTPTLYLKNDTDDQSSIFNNLADIDYVEQYRPDHADVVFLAGMDWQAYQPFFASEQIKINLVQHVRHGDKAHSLFQFLRHRAIRLCVSDAVKRAIEPFANGPCFTVNMGHDIPNIRLPKRYDLYVLASKQPALGRQLHDWARGMGLRVLIHDSFTQRLDIYHAMAESQVVITLPNKTEGFYLPGIEAMALADWVVVPDCIASREYSLPTANISACELSLVSCQIAILKALKSTMSWTARVNKWRGRKRAASYCLPSEERDYGRILQQLNHIW